MKKQNKKPLSTEEITRLWMNNLLGTIEKAPTVNKKPQDVFQVTIAALMDVLAARAVPPARIDSILATTASMYMMGMINLATTSQMDK